ncbi:MAG: 50S ribosomal protein L28 [Parcubacteria group bacterium GW2011_GWA2_56_7]|nr:MAG: 50S ribosomal protein L28 [Parcubacteria group bacterium GW2011_GWA2_56_7]
MANECIITGKKTVSGNNVSHSKRRTKRTFKPNLQKKTVMNPATGRPVKVTVSVRGLRMLKKWMREGKKVDLTNLS